MDTLPSSVTTATEQPLRIKSEATKSIFFEVSKVDAFNKSFKNISDYAIERGFRTTDITVYFF